MEEPWDTGAMPEKIHPWTGEGLHFYPQIIERSRLNLLAWRNGVRLYGDAIPPRREVSRPTVRPEHGGPYLKTGGEPLLVEAMGPRSQALKNPSLNRGRASFQRTDSQDEP